jgi:hypothetical protein
MGMCGPKRESVIREWRKWRSEELHSSHSFPNIILVVKSGNMRHAKHEDVCVECDIC